MSHPCKRSVVFIDFHIVSTTRTVRHMTHTRLPSIKELFQYYSMVTTL